MWGTWGVSMEGTQQQALHCWKSICGRTVDPHALGIAQTLPARTLTPDCAGRREPYTQLPLMSSLTPCGA
jgi:hypothetical protein